MFFWEREFSLSSKWGSLSLTDEKLHLLAAFQLQLNIYSASLILIHLLFKGLLTSVKVMEYLYLSTVEFLDQKVLINFL